MFVDFFIRRPIFASVCAIVLTLAGLLAIPSLPIAQYPELALPSVNVISTYPGASAEVVETAVTIPLEQELNGLEGMRYMRSTSTNTGVSRITLTFDFERDLDVAAVDVQNIVARVSSRLPAQVNQSGIVVNKASDQQLLNLGLFSDDDRYDPAFLSNYANTTLKDVIKRVPGVADVTLFGERKFAMRLWLDPTQLSRRGLTGQDVARALQEQNVQVAAGQVGLPPSGAEQVYQIAVRAQGRLTEPGEFEELVVQRGADGALVRLKDVGRAELGSESYEQLFRFDGHTGVGIGVYQLPTANALEVRDAVVAEIDRLAAQFPPGMQYRLAADTTLAVRESISEVLVTLAEAIGLVILVIALFLHGWRSVLVTALTLPVSLVGTFAFVKLFGFSINTLTLFGLTLATGLVVDDAIVVLENIERLMRERKLGAFEAAREGMREISSAVVAISIVLVSVFVPVAFFPGTTGAIYRQFALTIAASMALSAFCALTLTPALSALLLSHSEKEKWAIFRAVDWLLDSLRSLYAGAMRRLLAHPWALLSAFALVIGATVWMLRIAPTGFIPDEDQGMLIVAAQGPEGMSVTQTDRVVAQIEQILRAQPEVTGMFAVGGYSMLGAGPNTATVFVNLAPWDERRGENQSVSKLVERLRGPLSKIGGAKVMPMQPPAVRGLGNMGGLRYVLEDVSGRSYDEFAEAVDAVVSAAEQEPRLRGAFTSFSAASPLLDVQIDRQKTAAVGVPMNDVFGTLQLFLGGQYVNDFNYANRNYRVYLQAEQQFRDGPEDLSSFYVRNSGGQMIPLEALVKVTPTVSPQVIRRYNLFRTAELNAEPAPGMSSGQAMEAFEQLTLPDGMAGEWTGVNLEQKQSGRQAFMVFAIGLLFVFLVLAAQYESFSLPLAVILSVPTAVLGAVGLQYLRGLPNDVFCQVGLVMLIGLSSKNAILIVEFAEQLRAEGRDAVDAVIAAGATRLRPILMTSIAFLLGVTPLMLASGAGAAARNSLGTAVFGGMALSTFANLAFTPGLYVVVMRIFGGKRRATAVEDGTASAEATSAGG